MTIKLSCDRCGAESVWAPGNSFGSANINEKHYMLCPICAKEYDIVLNFLQAKREDVLLQWVNKKAIKDFLSKKKALVANDRLRKS